MGSAPPDMALAHAPPPPAGPAPGPQGQVCLPGLAGRLRRQLDGLHALLILRGALPRAHLPGGHRKCRLGASLWPSSRPRPALVPSEVPADGILDGLPHANCTLQGCLWLAVGKARGGQAGAPCVEHRWEAGDRCAAGRTGRRWWPCRPLLGTGIHQGGWRAWSAGPPARRQHQHCCWSHGVHVPEGACEPVCARTCAPGRAHPADPLLLLTPRDAGWGSDASEGALATSCRPSGAHGGAQAG